MPIPLSPAVDDALGPLVPVLAELGLRPTRCQESRYFRNFEVEFSQAARSVTIVRNRGQYSIRGERSALEAYGLDGEFATPRALRPALVAWLQASGAV